MPRQLVPLKRVPEHRSWTTERILRRLVAERRIPFHKCGGKVLTDLVDLDPYAEAGALRRSGDRGTGSRSHRRRQAGCCRK